MGSWIWLAFNKRRFKLPVILMEVVRVFKRKDVEEMRDTVYFKEGDEITFESVQDALAAQAGEARLPMAFRMDQIKEGALIGDTTPCLVVFHPAHPVDYYNMLVTIGRQGAYALVSVYAAGKSKQMGRFSRAALGKSVMEDVLAGKASGVDLAVGVIGGLSGAFGKNKSKHQEEQFYYQLCMELFDQVLS